jgi:hypothetical protein
VRVPMVDEQRSSVARRGIEAYGVPNAASSTSPTPSPLVALSDAKHAEASVVVRQRVACPHAAV